MYHASHFPGAQSWVVECNGATQGAIAFHESASPINGVKVLMISAIGSAPRNRRIGWNRYVRVRGFAGVGRALIKHASTVSINLGLNGAIGLYSAPQAEGFYEKVGLVKHGIADKRGFAYFESP
ncbi:MAG: hypothetical protein ORO03_00885 [Alphaproteobacteria bacterium]|nr:hypothetical protein [Alphaproteobacteria bacterium]